jgi:hypothetical protein
VNRLILILILILGMSAVNAQEITEGRIKLSFFEDLGRFTAYFREDLSEDTYKALFLDEDPRTSYLSILLDNRIYRMGESNEFTTRFSRTTAGAQFVFTSSRLKITQSFSFIRSSGSQLSDGFAMTITIENISESSLNVGLKYLIDTYLGEDEGIHFTVQDDEILLRETEYKTTVPSSWVSPTGKSLESGFQGMLSGSGITVPDRIVFANWKRLDDSSWNFDVNTNRNFNLLPYSINDSAVAMYYEPETLQSGESKSIVLAFGAYSPNGFTVSGTGTTIESVLNQSSSGLLSSDLLEDLLEIREAITSIDNYLNSGRSLSEEEYGILLQLIESYERKKNSYGE